jgi:hypothetical protein
MYYELLALEVNATIAGLDIHKPPFIQGKSGVLHRFNFLASEGNRNYGFDICSEADEVAILRSFAKKLDTGAETFIVCLSGRASPDAGGLAASYGIEILTPGAVGKFFSKKVIQQLRAPGISSRS